MSKEIMKLGADTFHPSSALTGNENPTVYRGRNMMLRGEPGSFYFEAFAGIKDLNEDIPMAAVDGLLSFTANSNVINGLGTSFKGELHIGQFILSGGELLVVEEVVSDTRFLCDRPPATSATNQVGYKMPVLFEMDNQRGTLIWGNALKFDLGNIVGVGEGQLRRNGHVLPGQSMVLNRKVKLAIFDPATGTYSVDRLGFSAVPNADDVKIRIVDGGKKNMAQGYYSFRWAWANRQTGYGFSNPSEVMKLTSTAEFIKINANNQRFQLDFTLALRSKPVNADSVIIYRSFYTTPSKSNETSFGEGSWYVADTVDIADFAAGDRVYIDVLDAELGTEVTFDNDVPPDAEWISTLAGDVVLVSCYGDKTPDRPEGTSPGPMLVPQRRGNRDGFPAATATPLSPPDTIIGFAASVGRIFLMTRVGLPFATSTGQADFPITTRPFWQTGFKGPFGLVFVNDTLYAFTSKGVTRSIANADEGSEQFEFAASVADITRNWYAGHVHAVHDPANELVCFIYAAAYKNEEGYWVSEVLPYSLRHQAFTPLITITKPGRDMIVCGAAKVNGHLQFIAGGRGNFDVLPGSSTESSSFPESGSSLETGSGSSIETAEREPFVPLAGALFTCGAECGYTGLSESAHFFMEAGGYGASISLASDRHRAGGLFSWKVVGSCRGAFQPIYSGPDSTQDVWVGKVYVNVSQAPLSDIYFIFSGNSSYGDGSGRVGVMGITMSPDKTFHCGGNLGAYWAGYPSMTQGPGVPFELNQWYRIDFKIDRANARVDGKVTLDGSGFTIPMTPAIFGEAVPVAETIRMGNIYPAGGDFVTYYVDDIIISNAEIDYPISDGYVLGLRPVSDGTHTIGGEVRKDGAGGTLATVGSTDLHEHVIQMPMTSGPGGVFDNPSIYSSGINTVKMNLGFPIGTPSLIHGPRLISMQCVGISPEFGDHGQVVLDDNGTLAIIADWDSTYTHQEAKNLYVPHPPSDPTGHWQPSGGNGNVYNLKIQYKNLAGRSLLNHVSFECEFEGIQGVD